jgi:hypothetical protein
MSRHVLVAGLLLALVAPSGAAPPGELRLRNRTPFMLTVYIGGVRSGWIKPFRTEVFRGLKTGQHKVYVASHYGSASWGPRRVPVPGTWNLTPPKDAKATDELEQALASRIYRRNRNSLAACDRLAERRGEDLTGRAEFEIKVDEKGKAAVTVRGEKLSGRTQACYRSMATTWEYPTTGEAYSVTFQHLR